MPMTSLGSASRPAGRQTGVFEALEWSAQKTLRAKELLNYL